jgi:hypothetical protein
MTIFEFETVLLDCWLLKSFFKATKSSKMKITVKTLTQAVIPLTVEPSEKVRSIAQQRNLI